MALILNLLLTNIFLTGLCFLSLRYGRDQGTRWIDHLNRFIRIQAPSVLRRRIAKFFGQKALQFIDSIISYVLYEKNPLTMILYFVLCIGGYIAYIISVYPYLPNETITFPFHKQIGFLLFCLSLFFFLQSASLNPGIITKANHSQMMKIYPFDGVVFKSGNVCPTCCVEKPARSKHCRMTNFEIARFDHYCMYVKFFTFFRVHCVFRWINQPMGLGNIKEFLLFLLFNNIMCLYGAYLGIGVLVNIVRAENLTEAWFRDSYSGNRYKASPYYILIYLMGRETLLVYMTILLLVLGIFLLFFSYYHWVTLMRKGITTNEQEKLKHLTPSQRNRFLKLYSQNSWWQNFKHIWNQNCPQP